MTNNEFNPNIMRDLQGFFRAGERKRLYLACDNIRDKVLVRLLWKSGRRIGEILKLKVREIDFENRNILWHIEKKYKLIKDDDGNPIASKKIDLTRIKPIDDWTLKLLEYYIWTEHLDEEDYVFPSIIYGKPITRQRAFQIIRRISQKSGIHFVGNKKPHPHHFRHSFAIDVAKKATSPADLRKLQMLLEHSSLDITEQYLQFGSEDLRSLIQDESD